MYRTADRYMLYRWYVCMYVCMHVAISKCFKHLTGSEQDIQFLFISTPEIPMRSFIWRKINFQFVMFWWSKYCRALTLLKVMGQYKKPYPKFNRIRYTKSIKNWIFLQDFNNYLLIFKYNEFEMTQRVNILKISNFSNLVFLDVCFDQKNLTFIWPYF